MHLALSLSPSFPFPLTMRRSGTVRVAQSSRVRSGTCPPVRVTDIGHALSATKTFLPSSHLAAWVWASAAATAGRRCRARCGVLTPFRRQIRRKWRQETAETSPRLACTLDTRNPQTPSLPPSLSSSPSLPLVLSLPPSLPLSLSFPPSLPSLPPSPILTLRPPSRNGNVPFRRPGRIRCSR